MNKIIVFLFQAHRTELCPHAIIHGLYSITPFMWVDGKTPFCWKSSKKKRGMTL